MSLDARAWAAALLQIRSSASLSEAQQAHRDLLMIWHPDRQGENFRFRQKAEEQSKKIKFAFDVFCGRDGGKDRACVAGEGGSGDPT